jgi:ketosteroid isomerase-like protein
MGPAKRSGPARYWIELPGARFPTQAEGTALHKAKAIRIMKNIFALLLVILVAAPAVAQSSKSRQKVERELIALERQLSEALARQDASVLDRLWSETLVFTFPNGQISNKAQRLAAQKPAADSNQLTNRNEEVKVYLYGNSAVVTVRSRWLDQAGTKQLGDPYQATHVWVKQNGRWQLVAAHVSQVKS